jgi:site-specific DNA-methyltransferase (adenine-specific)
MRPKYKVIYADPPWSYRNKRTGGSMNSGSEQKFATMILADILSLPVSSVADKDSVLFLWATTPLLPEALSVLPAWGFTYKTSLYWRKIMSLGMGFWYRGQVEQLLLGVRGKIKAFRIQKPNFIQAKVRNHSQKPVEVRELVEMCNLDPKLELFATESATGWDCIGNAINGEDIRVSLARIIAEQGGEE